jgi:predicted type IV restriction endonuclease
MAIDIRKPLKKYLPHLAQAQTDNLNEADTVQRMIKVFEDVLGYDAMTEISRESAIKDRYADVALKIEGAIRLLVEVKSAGTVLRHKHIEQAQNYAANGNIRWVILTNGMAWNLYHLTFEEGIEATLAFSVDLGQEMDRACGLLCLLHRNAVKKGELDAYWEQRVALSPASIGRALFTEDALRFIRRAIRKREGILIDEEDLVTAIHEMLSTEAREQIGPPKIRRRAKRVAKPAAETSVTAPPTSTAAEPPCGPEEKPEE